MLLDKTFPVNGGLPCDSENFLLENLHIYVQSSCKEAQGMKIYIVHNPKHICIAAIMISLVS